MSLSPQDKELCLRIDEVLLYMWDPIGVRDTPQTRDEYESYVPHVFHLLKTTTDGKDVAEYLNWLCTEHIGMPPNRAHDMEIVEVLVQWRNYLNEMPD